MGGKCQTIDNRSSCMASRDTAFEGLFDQYPEALEEGIRALSRSPLGGTPGEAFGYAHAKFNILGLLVQTVIGQPFGDYSGSTSSRRWA